VILAVTVARQHSASASLLAPAGSPSGLPIDGIPCQTNEQILFHIHAHLAVFVNGHARIIPEGIGIVPPRQIVQTSEGPFVVGGRCFYWLHSHGRDGVIHIESPVTRTYTMGNYFNIWGQPLSATQIGPVKGAVITWVDGARYPGDPRSIPLTAHAVIQFDVGLNIPPEAYVFASGL
jgi:hypothetical protein